MAAIQAPSTVNLCCLFDSGRPSAPVRPTTRAEKWPLSSASVIQLHVGLTELGFDGIPIQQKQMTEDNIRLIPKGSPRMLGVEANKPRKLARRFVNAIAIG